jgi:hypothetical protein
MTKEKVSAAASRLVAFATLGCLLACSGSEHGGRMDVPDGASGGEGPGATGGRVGTGGGGTGGGGTGGRSTGGTGPSGGAPGGAGGGGGSHGGGTGASGGRTGGRGGAGAAGSGGLGGGGTATGGRGDGGVPPGPITFSKNVRLNDDTGRGRQAEVALAAGPQGLVLAGWMDERAERVCAFSFSTDSGLTWSKNVSIANVGSFVGDPAVAIDGAGTLYAVCQQYLDSNASTGETRLMTSTDKGQTWSAVKTVQSNPDKPWAAGGTQDGVVFISWLGNPGGIKRSTDHGATWGPIQSTGNIIHGTAIVPSESGLLHVPYNLDSDRNQLRYLRSKNNGDTYETPRDLVKDMGTFCFNCNPRQHPIVGAAADPTGKYVAITWASQMPAGEGDDDVWLIYSKDGGDTWTAPLRVNDNKTKSRQFEPWVAVDATGRVHVAWTDYRDSGNNETWYTRSSNPAAGFEPNIQVTDGHGSGATDFLGDYKGIVVQGSDVLVVWQDTRRDVGDIYFARAAGAAAP